MSYKRKFVTLSSVHSETKAFGKCLLEYQGGIHKVSVSIQNVKPETIYKILMSSNLGELDKFTVATDKKGNGEFKAELTESFESAITEEIGKISIREKNTLVKVLEGDTGNNITPPVVIQEVIEEEPKVVQEVVIEPEVKLPHPDEIPQKIYNPHILETTIEQETTIAQDETPETPTSSPFDSIDMEKVIKLAQGLKAASVIHTDLKDTIEDDFITKSRVARNTDIESLFQNNTKMKPFKEQKRNFKWIRLNLKELIYLPAYLWSLSKEEFILERYEKYNHLILGINVDNNKEFILGLPDIYDEKNKLIANKQGFVQFKCADGEDLRDGAGGYWLMSIYI